MPHTPQELLTPDPDFASQIDPSENSHLSAPEIQNPLPNFPFNNSQKNPDQESLSGDQIQRREDDFAKEQRQQDHDHEEDEDEEGIIMPISPLSQSVGTKVDYSKCSSRRKKKSKRGFLSHAVAIQKKMQALSENFNPVPFVPGKVVDFSEHAESLKKLGLWDFAHVVLDRVIRGELIKQLIVNYVPKNRVSYVNGVRVKVSRADLARALKLPVRKPAVGDLDGEVFSAEFLGFLEEFVSNWMLLHDSDVWVTPSEVINWLKLIREGLPQKVDWAGLIWFMMEKELTQRSDLEDCCYVSHFQQLIKDQKEDLLKDTIEVVVENQEMVEVFLEDKKGGDTKMLYVEESFSGQEKSVEQSSVLRSCQDCVTQVGKDGASGIGAKDSDSELGRKDDSEMAPKAGDSELGQKDGDSVLGQKDGDFEFEPKDVDSVLGQKDGDSELLQKDADFEIAQKDGDSEMAQEGDDSEMVQEDGDVKTAPKDGDSEMAQKDGTVDMIDKGDDSYSVKTKVGAVDEVKNENTEDSMTCLDEAGKVGNAGNDEFAENALNYEGEYREVHLPDFRVHRQWLGTGSNDVCQPFFKPCSMAGDKMFSENAGPHVGVDDVEDVEGEDYGQVQGFKILSKSNMDGMSSVSLMRALETGQLPYASTENGGPSSLELMSTRDENDMMLDRKSLFNHIGKREIDFEHDISHHSMNENHKRIRMDGQWNHKPAEFSVCMDQICHWVEKAKASHEADKEEAYQQTNMVQRVYSQQVEEQNAEILQLRCKVDELQRRRQADVSRRDRELHLMNSVIHGYQMALKKTQMTFAEYRKRCHVPDEPFYKDAGSVGVVKSIKELERERLLKEEEQRNMRHLLQDAFNRFLNDLESRWQQRVVCEIDDCFARLEFSVEELELLRAKIIIGNASKNVMMSEDVENDNVENDGLQNGDGDDVQRSGAQIKDAQSHDAQNEDVHNDDAPFKDVLDGDTQTKDVQNEA